MEDFDRHIISGKAGKGKQSLLDSQFPRSRAERALSNLEQDWKPRTDPRASLEKGPAPTSLNLSVWIS